MNKYVLCFFELFFILYLNCSLIEPSKLIIKNESEYSIKVTISNNDNKNVIIEKKKGEMFFINPGNFNFTIKIDSIYFEKKYHMSIGYLENKKFVFNLKF